MNFIETLRSSRLVGWVFRHRFVKFGTVGGSGVLINLGVLYLGQEYLFTAIESPSMRLNVSLCLAILCATGNNFTWNRLWTWEDRKHKNDKPLLLQFGQYTLACLLGILLQMAFTKMLAAHVHYLLANFIAIAAAGIFNYLVNDAWTFGLSKLFPGKWPWDSAGTSNPARPEGRPGREAHVPPPPRGTRSRLIWFSLIAVLAVFTYFFGLDSQHIPKNGDEYPYTNITRMTAESGALLPLRSSMAHMRNTKPPMLFWQGIASTHRGQRWTLWHLRYPSVIYSVVTALMVFLLARKLSGRTETGFLASLTFLAFFSTYRYGRPFLTNPPEVFWLFLPFFSLLYWRPVSFRSRFVFPVLLGVAVGIGLLYKSFALVLPVGLGLAAWFWQHRDYSVGTFLARDSRKIFITMAVSLAIFGLWFVFDPDPQSVWREFIVQENVGKLDEVSGGYLSHLLWGGSSIWSLALGYPLNAGLLAFPVAALFFMAFTRRHTLSDEEKLLWMWVLVLFLVFCLPRQRSGRYLLSAMPALAILLALNWDRIRRMAFVMSIIATAIFVAAMAYASIRMGQYFGGVPLYGAIYWVLLAITGIVLFVALLTPALTRACLNAGILLAFLSLAAFLRPFDGPMGSYSPETQRRVEGKDVWVPYNFNAKYERYRFMLPGARIHGYREEPGLQVTELAGRFPLFAVRLSAAETPGGRGKILGQRLDIRSRQTSREIKEMIFSNALEHAFVREFLIETDQGRD
jgi:putative flippase GtrA/4-amino-4-deoxy-L-arabinose transferase-like glycosyltransferase